ECVVVTLFYRRDFLFSIYTKYFTLSEKIHQDKNKQNTLLTKAIQLMRNNIDLNLQIQEIAQILSIDRTYLHRIFKENIGTSPKQYLINLKMTRAKELLINTDSPLNVISLSVGIDDVANFSKLFKKNENMSPKQYRQKYQLQKKHK
ncbi:AraC family transcriptional regulator, partial [Enterococcus faecium]|uniref:helix-turn-helix domain-containing protein n=1 Tax=Enterococcus faecium TaxID=1352 RepID=UPI002543B9FC